LYQNPSKTPQDCEAVQAQFMSRGVGEMAAWRAEQREASKPHQLTFHAGDATVQTTFFISMKSFENLSPTHGV